MSDRGERLLTSIPTVREVDDRIGMLLRELHLARGLRKLAERAGMYREIEGRPTGQRQQRQQRRQQREGSATVAG